MKKRLMPVLILLSGILAGYAITKVEYKENKVSLENVRQAFRAIPYDE